jgi:hypothetical protein
MICLDCGLEKPPEDFPQNHRTKSGRGTYCKACHNARTRAAIKRRHGDTRHYHLRQRYGIGAAEVDDLVDRQGGLCDGMCAICREAPAVHVDHDHRTKEVRGVLCFNCNRGLGYLDDDLVMLCRAADYLESRGSTS